METRPHTTPRRYLAIDALRGLAILLMVVYHFCFDLSYFDLVDFDFYRDPFWLHSRTIILSLFLVLVGVSLALATAGGFHARRILRRLALLVASAALVSASTWWLFGERFVFFGVLHFIALASVLGLLFVRMPWLALLLGGLILVLGNLYEATWFDEPGRRWIGLMTHKPATEDYVPLLPWFGVVLIGIFAGQQLQRLDWLRLEAQGFGLLASLARYLAFAGRHSLLIYLVHQPLLMGALSGFLALMSQPG